VFYGCPVHWGVCLGQAGGVALLFGKPLFRLPRSEDAERKLGFG
ncbi:uncharacterized protein METZ01_LOCUS234275, partial [marine metagenome]